MALTNAYLKKVYEDLSSRCASEKEFLQAVEEVFESLEPVLEKHQEYEAAGHCAAYDLPSGETVFICHGYSTRLNGASILIQKTIKWTSDGWPTL